MQALARRALSVMLLAGTVALAGPARTEEPSPRTVVESLHETLIEVMQNAEALGYEGRYARLEPVITGAFDLPFMARKSVGRHWKDLGENQRRQLLDTFTRLTLSTYAARFDGYRSEPRFETLGSEPGGRETVLVRTQLVRRGEETVQLNYRLRLADQEWRVIDIFLNGTISELALRRSEYSSVIKRDGFDALIDALEQRIANYSAGEDPDA